MKSFVLSLVLLFSGASFADAQIVIRNNIFGGVNIYENGRLQTTSRPNIFGGQNYRGRTTGWSQPRVVSKEFRIKIPVFTIRDSNFKKEK